MRETKFRVWDKDQEEYFPICEDLGFGLIGITVKGNNILFVEDGEISTGDAEDYTIEQFTGLKDKNGIFIEDLLIIARAKLTNYNNQLPCRENQLAIDKIDEAILWLTYRKAEREHRGVYGTEAK